VMAGQ